MEGLRLDVGGETLALDRILEKENQTGGGSYLLEDLRKRGLAFRGTFRSTKEVSLRWEKPPEEEGREGGSNRGNR